MVANTQMVKGQKKDLTKLWYLAFAAIMLLALVVLCVTTSHADLVDDVKTAAVDVYTDVTKVATPVAAASIAIALLFTNFSHNTKVVDGSRLIAKGIAITWIVIMLLGAFFTYGKGIVDKIQGGRNLPEITAQVSFFQNQLHLLR